jgi:hypothetical protein
MPPKSSHISIPQTPIQKGCIPTLEVQAYLDDIKNNKNGFVNEIEQEVTMNYSDINIRETGGKVCDNNTCKFTHIFNKPFPIDFVNDDIKIRGTRSLSSIKPEVQINKTFFTFNKIDFLLSRTVNNYNGKEVSGEIIIFLTEYNNNKNELYISIPIIKYKNIDMINKTTNDILRNKTLTSFYNQIGNSIPVSSSDEILTLNDLVIGDLFPDVDSYYYRTEKADDTYNKRTFISYDVTYGIKISDVLYKTSANLTSKININALKDYESISDYLYPLKNLFITISGLYHKPTANLIEQFTNNDDDDDDDDGDILKEKDDIFISCIPITHKKYNSSKKINHGNYDQLLNASAIKKMIKKNNKKKYTYKYYFVFIVSIILIICALYSLYVIGKRLIKYVST